MSSSSRILLLLLRLLAILLVVDLDLFVGFLLEADILFSGKLLLRPSSTVNASNGLRQTMSQNLDFDLDFDLETFGGALATMATISAYFLS